jgi:anti-sigma factor RsiW
VTRRRAPAHCAVDPRHWSRYLDGEFSSARCRECEAHLAGCADCRRQLGDLRHTVKALEAAGRQAVPPAVRAAFRRRARAAMARQR